MCNFIFSKFILQRECFPDVYAMVEPSRPCIPESCIKIKLTLEVKFDFNYSSKFLRVMKTFHLHKLKYLFRPRNTNTFFRNILEI